MWDNVPLKIFIIPVLNIQIIIGNDLLNNLLDFVDSDVEKLSTG